MSIKGTKREMSLSLWSITNKRTCLNSVNSIANPFSPFLGLHWPSRLILKPQSNTWKIQDNCFFLDARVLMKTAVLMNSLTAKARLSSPTSASPDNVTAWLPRSLYCCNPNHIDRCLLLGRVTRLIRGHDPIRHRSRLIQFTVLGRIAEWRIVQYDQAIL